MADKLRFPSRYCNTCGSLMGHSKPKVVGYDEYTGKPYVEVNYRCPRWGFFSLGHSMTTISTSPRLKVQLGESEDD